MSYREPAKVLADILQIEMGLSADQVRLGYQKYEVPPGLSIVIQPLGPGKVIAVSSECVDDGAGGLTEVQSVTLFGLLQVDILSFGPEARTRKEEIALALRSITSQQKQAENTMQIAPHPGGFMDTSFSEDVEYVQRYTTTVATTSVMQKTKAAPYFTGMETKIYDGIAAAPAADFDPRLAPSHTTP